MFNNNKNELIYDKCPTEIKVFSCDSDGANTASSEADDDQQHMLRDAKEQLRIVSVERAAPLSKVFIDDLTEQRKVWRIPWFTINMCFVQISLYAIANECIYQHFMFIPTHRTEYWRYFTYTLLHSDLVHLLLNVCLQCLIGFCLESEQGHWKVALVYAGGGVFGSLATLLLQPRLSLMGASAGVYALLMSHIPHMLKNFPSLPHRYLRVVALVILCLSDIGFSTFHVLVNRNANPRICLEAHIAGALAGLCLGFLLYSNSSSGGGNGCCYYNRCCNGTDCHNRANNKK